MIDQSEVCHLEVIISRVHVLVNICHYIYTCIYFVAQQVQRQQVTYCLQVLLQHTLSVEHTENTLGPHLKVASNEIVLHFPLK